MEQWAVLLQVEKGLDHESADHELGSSSSSSSMVVVDLTGGVDDDDKTSCCIGDTDNSHTCDTLLPPLPAKDLQEMYGPGFKLLTKMGHTVGRGFGESEQGIAYAIPHGDMLQDRSSGIGRTDRDPEQQRSRVSSAHIRPPQCRNCLYERWPAYRAITPAAWTCKWSVDM